MNEGKCLHFKMSLIEQNKNDLFQDFEMYNLSFISLYHITYNICYSVIHNIEINRMTEIPRKIYFCCGGKVFQFFCFDFFSLFFHCKINKVKSLHR